MLIGFLITAAGFLMIYGAVGFYSTLKGPWVSDFVNFSVGMNEDLCIRANGQPTWRYEQEAPPKLRGFYPDPERKPNGPVLVYEYSTTCVLVYFGPDGLSEFIYIAYT